MKPIIIDGVRLHDWRVDKHILFYAAMHITGLGRTTLYNIESKKRATVRESTLSKLATVYPAELLRALKVRK